MTHRSRRKAARWKLQPENRAQYAAISWSEGMWRDILAWARRCGPRPFYLKRHKRMAGK